MAVHIEQVHEYDEVRVSSEIQLLHDLEQNSFAVRSEVIDRNEDILYRSYLPTSDILHIRELMNSGDIEAIKAYKQEQRQNIITNLMERFHVVESGGTYSIENNQLYSEYFPYEPFGQVMMRGYVFRKEHGSKEQEREGFEGELAGWSTIKKIMTDPATKIGSTLVSFSPPGLISHSAYTGRFIDTFELSESNSKRFVRRMRYAVDYDYEEYQSKALQLDPTFFDTYDGRPLDAWYVSHPVMVQGDLSSVITKGSGMTGEMFRNILSWKDKPLQRFIDYYIELCYEDSTRWEDIYLAFNAIINRADEIEEEIREKRSVSMYNYADIHDTFLYYVRRLGMKTVKEVQGGGCPGNKGFSLLTMFIDVPFADSLQPPDIFSNSVIQFGTDLETEETWEYHQGNCRRPPEGCGKKNVDVGPCHLCKECEKKY